MSTKSMLAVAGAVAAAAALALSAPAAHASVNAGTVHTTNEAGWQAHGNGWNFRYLQATVTLPDITNATFRGAIPHGYGASLRLGNGSQIADLGISTTPSPDPGNYNAAFAVEYSDGHTYGCLNGASPVMAPGDTVTMTLFYDYTGGNLSYSVADRTNHTSFAHTCHDPGQFFGSAQVVTGFSVNDWAAATGVHAPSGNHRLVMFNNTVVTSRTGIRSSIGTGSGHWPTQKIAMTSDGTPTGTLLASVPFAWGKFAVSPDSVVRDGRNFSVWMPSAS